MRIIVERVYATLHTFLFTYIWAYFEVLLRVVFPSREVNARACITCSEKDKVKKVVYVDYAGAGIPAPEYMTMVCQELIDNPLLCCNPHSLGPLASDTRNRVKRVREVRP
jgi:hypothetical protein